MSSRKNHQDHLPKLPVINLINRPELWRPEQVHGYRSVRFPSTATVGREFLVSWIGVEFVKTWEPENSLQDMAPNLLRSLDKHKKYPDDDSYDEHLPASAVEQVLAYRDSGRIQLGGYPILPQILIKWRRTSVCQSTWVAMATFLGFDELRKEIVSAKERYESSNVQIRHPRHPQQVQVLASPKESPFYSRLRFPSESLECLSDDEPISRMSEKKKTEKKRSPLESLATNHSVEPVKPPSRKISKSITHESISVAPSSPTSTESNTKNRFDKDVRKLTSVTNVINLPPMPHRTNETLRSGSESSITNSSDSDSSCSSLETRKRLRKSFRPQRPMGHGVKKSKLNSASEGRQTTLLEFNLPSASQRDDVIVEIGDENNEEIEPGTLVPDIPITSPEAEESVKQLLDSLPPEGRKRMTPIFSELLRRGVPMNDILKNIYPEEDDVNIPQNTSTQSPKSKSLATQAPSGPPPSDANVVDFPEQYESSHREEPLSTFSTGHHPPHQDPDSLKREDGKKRAASLPPPRNIPVQESTSDIPSVSRPPVAEYPPVRHESLANALGSSHIQPQQSLESWFRSQMLMSSGSQQVYYNQGLSNVYHMPHSVTGRLLPGQQMLSNLYPSLVPPTSAFNATPQQAAQVLFYHQQQQQQHAAHQHAAQQHAAQQHPFNRSLDPNAKPLWQQLQPRVHQPVPSIDNRLGESLRPPTTRPPQPPSRIQRNNSTYQPALPAERPTEPTTYLGSVLRSTSCRMLYDFSRIGVDGVRERCFCETIEALAPSEQATLHVLKKTFERLKSKLFPNGGPSALRCNTCLTRTHIDCGLAWVSQVHVLSDRKIELFFKDYICIACRLQLSEPFHPVVEISDVRGRSSRFASDQRCLTTNLEIDITPEVLEKLTNRIFRFEVRCLRLSPSFHPHYADFPCATEFPQGGARMFLDPQHETSTPFETLKPPKPFRKRRDVPVAVTGIKKIGKLKLLLELDIKPSDNEVYVFALLKTQSMDPEKITQFIHKRPLYPADRAEALAAKLLSQEHQNSDEIAVVTSDHTISLRCPSTLDTIKTPGRSIKCAHLQCFDLEYYVQSQTQVTWHTKRWRCPICELPAYPLYLFVDGFMEKILENTSDQDKTVYLQVEGSTVTWRVTEIEASPSIEDEEGVSSSGKAKVKKTKSPPACEVIELLDDD